MSNKTTEAVQMLTLTAHRYGIVLSDQQTDIWMDDLRDLCSEYEGLRLEGIKAAFRAHIRDPKHGSFMPKLADIVRHLPQGTSVYPEAAAAWAIAVKAQDEANSVCWTPLISEAFFAAKPLLDARDTFGARAAFVSFYDRAVQADKALPAELRRSAWTMTLGHDVQLREVVREQAVAQGLLPAPEKRQSIAYEAPEDPAVKAQVFAQIERLGHKITMVKPAPALAEIAQSTAPMPAPQRLRLAA